MGILATDAGKTTPMRAIGMVSDENLEATPAEQIPPQPSCRCPRKVIAAGSFSLLTESLILTKGQNPASSRPGRHGHRFLPT